MVRVFIKNILIFFFFSATLQASLFRDEIFVGKNNEKYTYFFTITEYTSLENIEKKLNNKNFSFKNNLKLLLIVEIPNNLNESQQKVVWNKLKALNSSLNKVKYKYDIKTNGFIDKNLSMYEIHLYYR